MNKTFLIVIAVIVIVGGIFLFTQKPASIAPPSETPPPPTAEVPNPPPPAVGNVSVIDMTDRGFVHDKVTIKQGDTVVFENVGIEDHWPASNIHPTHQIYPEFDPKRPIPAGQSWSFTFEKIGIWRMHDHLSPQFTGAVTVE